MIYRGKDGVFALYRDHYNTAELHLDNIPRREWGLNVFSPELKGWKRNLVFKDEGELRERLTQNRPPAGLFAGTATYLDPNEIDKKKRDLIGFDFVIDLDEDDADYENRTEFINAMREKTKAVVDRFLVDLGFPLEAMQIDFSGKKGFHLTFESKMFRDLDVSSRRQIVDYIMGNKLDRSSLLPTENLTKYGWSSQMMHFISKLVADPCKENIEKYFAKKYVKKLGSLFSDPDVIARLKTGSLKDFDKKVLISGMMKEHRITIKDVFDRKPTVDSNRLFRIPGSLHPKSGLPCVRLTRYHLDSTELIIDEIMEVAGEDEVTVELAEDIEIDFPVKKTILAGQHKMKRYEALVALTTECKKKW